LYEWTGGVGGYIESEDFVSPMPESADILKETVGNAVGGAHPVALQNFWREIESRIVQLSGLQTVISGFRV
jgi:hypothetical protein